MQSIRYVRTSLVVSVVSLLAACGGGGSDSAPQNSTLKLDPANYGSQPASIRTMADLDAASTAYEDVQNVQTLVQNVGSAFEGTTVAPAAVSSTGPALCAVDNGNFEVTDQKTASTELLEYRFDNCVVPGYSPQLVLNGSVRTNTKFAESTGKIVIEESYNISGTLGPEETPIAINGRQTTNATFRTETDADLTISTPVMEYLYGTQYVAVSNSSLNATLNGDRMTFGINSRLIGSSLGGYVTITTPTPISAGMNGGCPNAGHIRIAGDGMVEARFGANSATGTGTEVLLNGSQVEYQEGCNVNVPALGGTNTGAVTANGSDPNIVTKSVLMPGNLADQ